VFGICRGLQLINVAHGGTLYQDISTQKPGALVHRDAAPTTSTSTRSTSCRTPPGQLLRRGRHKINSVHHQGIKDVAPGFGWRPCRPRTAWSRRSATRRAWLAPGSGIPNSTTADRRSTTRAAGDFLRRACRRTRNP
jgi:putative glutamine amidotransferase